MIREEGNKNVSRREKKEGGNRKWTENMKHCCFPRSAMSVLSRGDVINC